MASQRSLLPCGAWTATWTLLLRFVATPLLTAGSALAVGLRGTVFKIAVVQVMYCCTELWCPCCLPPRDSVPDGYCKGTVLHLSLDECFMM